MKEEKGSGVDEMVGGESGEREEDVVSIVGVGEEV